MKGLIIKDFKMIRHESIISLLIPTLFFIISMIGHNVMYFTCFSVMMFSLVPTMNIANDEKWKWDKYETVLPIKKEHIVLEKYIMLFLFVIPIILIESVIIYLITGYSAHDMASLVSIMFLFGILSPAIILPVYYLFGYNTGRIAGIPLTVIIYIVFSAVSMKNSTTDSIIRSEFLPQANPIVFSITAITLICISIIISIMVYKRKEF